MGSKVGEKFPILRVDERFNVECVDDDDKWMPTKGHPYDCCWDVRARACDYAHVADEHYDDAKLKEENIFSFWPGETVLVKTGIFVELKPGWEIQVRPRSGICRFQGIMVKNSPGTVDSSYRSEVGILLYNQSQDEPFDVRYGDRVAQLKFARVPYVELDKVKEISRELDRGGGFGHTGTK